MPKFLGPNEGLALKFTLIDQQQKWYSIIYLTKYYEFNLTKLIIF